MGAMVVPRLGEALKNSTQPVGCRTSGRFSVA